MPTPLTNEIEQSIAVLNSGGLLLYPTDTVWGLGCDATNTNAVATVFNAKQRLTAKSLVILVSDLGMLNDYVRHIRPEEMELLTQAEVPTTLIYHDPVGLANLVVAQDNTVAIRIPKHDFCVNLIKRFGRPIVSTSANISGQVSPTSFKEIDPSILEASDYVVNLEREKDSKAASRILKVLKNGTVQVIRD